MQESAQINEKSARNEKSMKMVQANEYFNKQMSIRWKINKN